LIGRGETAAPIERLNLLVLIDAEDVGHIRGINTEDVTCGIELDMRGGMLNGLGISSKRKQDQ
jgi:hypothetical protein